MLLLSSSPGPRGGAGALGIAKGGFPYAGGTVVGSFSLPSFYENFSPEEGIKNTELLNAFTEQANLFQAKL